MNPSIEFRAIGIVHSPFANPGGMAIQPRGAGAADGYADVYPEYQEGLQDLDGFSHAILLYHFHRASGGQLVVTPFLDEKSRGVFATRAPARPNPIGLSVVRIARVDGRRIYLEDIDIVDGTPLLDIKPYVPQFDHPEGIRIGWLAGRADMLGEKTSDDRFE